MLAIGHLPLIAFLGLRNNDIIIFLPGNGLDAVDRLRKEIIVDIAYNDPDGFAPSPLQALRDSGYVEQIGKERAAANRDAVATYA